MITAEGARDLVLEYLQDTIDNAIRHACHEGKFETKYGFPTKFRPDLVEGLRLRLDTEGFFVTEARTDDYLLLTISWEKQHDNTSSVSDQGA